MPYLLADNGKKSYLCVGISFFYADKYGLHLN